MHWRKNFITNRLHEKVDRKKNGRGASNYSFAKYFSPFSCRFSFFPSHDTDLSPPIFFPSFAKLLLILISAAFRTDKAAAA